MRRPIEGELGQPEWVANPERSNTLTIRFFVWIALQLGRTTARLLLYPICVYFILFSRKAKLASRKYLGRSLGRKAGFTDVFRHFHTFGAMVLDRVFLLNDQFSRFDVRVHGVTFVDDMIDRGEGCLLLGAHLGSFEVLRSLGRDARGLRVSLVMYEENARKTNAAFAAINPSLSMDIIALGKLDSMLKVDEVLKGGGVVGILADRTIAGEGTATCSFLGAEAQFPVGPFRLAAMLRRPIVLMFGIYRGGNRYDIYFEQLTNVVEVNKKDRGGMVEEWQKRYVSRLEHYCRLAPYNWFNFYDFWN